MRLRRALRSCHRSPVVRISFVIVSLVYIVHCFSFTTVVNMNDPPDPAVLEPHEKENLPQMPTNINESQISATGRVLDWREAEPGKNAIYLYSGYIDKRKAQPTIRLIAIIKRKTKAPECTYWSASNKREVKSGSIKLIKENWALPYSAGFILCPLPSFGPDDPVIRVGVTTQSAGPALLANSVPVENMESRKKIGEMSVCVKPFHYEFNRALWLVEFIEMYKLLGADHFIFYNHTVGPDVEAVLRYYMRQGSVEVLPWSLPVETKKDIRTEGIFASLNDCNLRSVGHFPLAAMVDIDEFLIPRKDENLLELVARLGTTYHGYVFKNVFFYLYWENDTALHDHLNTEENLQVNLFGADSHMPYLLTQTKTRRLDQPHKYGVRSKYLARPDKSVEVGNHVVWEYLQPGGRTSLNVPETDGLTHHYRICEFGGWDCLKLPSHIDQTAHRYLATLTQAIARECAGIFPGLPACPVAPPLGSPW